MTTIEAKVPDYLAALAQEATVKEKTTLDQIAAVALSAQLSAWKVREDMETRAKRGRPEDLRDILAKVPDAPPLRGDDFLATWKGRNTAELFERIRSTMPTDSPGSLSGQRYLDIVAYILSANGFPAGESELPPDPAVLRSIVITSQKP